MFLKINIEAKTLPSILGLGGCLIVAIGMIMDFIFVLMGILIILLALVSYMYLPWIRNQGLRTITRKTKENDSSSTLNLDEKFESETKG